MARDLHNLDSMLQGGAEERNDKKKRKVRTYTSLTQHHITSTRDPKSQQQTGKAATESEEKATQSATSQ